jgi:hypothetical protein
VNIRIRRTKRGATSIVFKADSKSDKEGADLKTALLAAVTAQGGFSPLALVEELDKLGYELVKMNGRNASGEVES